MQPRRQAERRATREQSLTSEAPPRCAGDGEGSEAWLHTGSDHFSDRPLGGLKGATLPNVALLGPTSALESLRGELVGTSDRRTPGRARKPEYSDIMRRQPFLLHGNCCRSGTRGSALRESTPTSCPLHALGDEREDAGSSLAGLPNRYACAFVRPVFWHVSRFRPLQTGTNVIS